MPDLRTFTLWARELLTRETGELLQQVYRIDPRTGTRLAVPKGHLLETSAEAQANRKRIEQLLDDEVEAGLDRAAAVAKLIRETAFTHLNRLVAFKLLEARKLVRGVLAKHHQANGFLMWLAQHPEEEALYHQGDNPNDRDGFGEAPRDRAYRHFLLWQSAQLAKEIRVLFDPDNVPSLLFPRPDVLKELIDALNAEEREPDWAPGNEETIGWVYQFFITDEKAAAFDKVFKHKKKFEKADVAACTQVFTPRWIVRFLVENSLGRLWLAMHPDSGLRERLGYLVPLPNEPPSMNVKPVKEIRVLDPACGSMHFGLVAFDLLVEMYREELERAGSPGWPDRPSVESEAQIPAAIPTHNLHGIDIDPRVVQLSALALYLKAKPAKLDRAPNLTHQFLICVARLRAAPSKRERRSLVPVPMVEGRSRQTPRLEHPSSPVDPPRGDRTCTAHFVGLQPRNGFSSSRCRMRSCTNSFPMASSAMRDLHAAALLLDKVLPPVIESLLVPCQQGLTALRQDGGGDAIPASNEIM